MFGLRPQRLTVERKTVQDGLTGPEVVDTQTFDIEGILQPVTESVADLPEGLDVSRTMMLWVRPDVRLEVGNVEDDTAGDVVIWTDRDGHQWRLVVRGVHDWSEAWPLRYRRYLLELEP